MWGRRLFCDNENNFLFLVFRSILLDYSEVYSTSYLSRNFLSPQTILSLVKVFVLAHDYGITDTHLSDCNTYIFFEITVISENSYHFKKGYSSSK